MIWCCSLLIVLLLEGEPHILTVGLSLVCGPELGVAVGMYGIGPGKG